MRWNCCETDKLSCSGQMWSNSVSIWVLTGTKIVVYRKAWFELDDIRKSDGKYILVLLQSQCCRCYNAEKEKNTHHLHSSRRRKVRITKEKVRTRTAWYAMSRVKQFKRRTSGNEQSRKLLNFINKNNTWFLSREMPATQPLHFENRSSCIKNDSLKGLVMMMCRWGGNEENRP